MKGTLADECDITEEALSAACMEYESKMEELQGLLKAQQPAMSQILDMADNVKKIKLSIPEPKAAPNSPALAAALAEAKRITEEKGLTSPEAAVAWDNVEEIASAGSSNAMGGKITEDECLVEAALEACEAMAELNRVLGGKN